jgi:hypothetical protein
MVFAQRTRMQNLPQNDQQALSAAASTGANQQSHLPTLRLEVRLYIMVFFARDTKDTR